MERPDTLKPEQIARHPGNCVCRPCIQDRKAIREQSQGDRRLNSTRRAIRLVLDGSI